MEKHTPILKNCKSWVSEACNFVVKNNKTEFVLLILVLLVGAFVRLYKIDQYMTFLGDEGRDVIIVRRLFTELHPPLIGPGTSIGNMYLGPLYYYLMAIPLLIANFNPVGPAIFVALLGVATIFLLWFVTKEWFGKKGALVAAFLYAISPVVIIYSRSSWNPNIMPFFALLTVYGIWRVWQRDGVKWLPVVGFSFAAMMQSHYLALIVLPVILIVWFMTLLKVKNKKKYWIYSIFGFVVFLLLMSPLAIFDYRHGWHNFAAIKEFFAVRQTTVSVKPWKSLPLIWPIFNDITTRLVGGTNRVAGGIVAGIITLTSIYVYLFKREKYSKMRVSVILVLSLWLGFGLIGLGLYKQQIYDHYYGFIFTAPFIIFGGIFECLVESKRFKKIGTMLAGILVLILTFFNIQNSPLRHSPNMQLTRTQTIARRVMEVANGEKFNFTIIAERNYDNAYRYFLNIWGAKVTDIDPMNTKDTITAQLLVVCELPKEKCDPTHNPKAEVANFGWSKIDVTWEVEGTTLFKLGHAR